MTTDTKPNCLGTLNIQLVDALIAWLEDGRPVVEACPITFKMSTFFETGRGSCGTSACLAGAAVIFGARAPSVRLSQLAERESQKGPFSLKTDGAKALGVPDKFAELLFVVSDLDLDDIEALSEYHDDYEDDLHDLRYDQIDAARAARALRYLKATGRVSWFRNPPE